MSNSPLGPSAYSGITRYMANIFKDAGHEVNIFAYWGIDRGHPLKWNGMDILPRAWDPWGRDIFMEHFKRTNSDILMPIFDIWVAPNLGEECDRVVAYSPTDHDPMSVKLYDAFKSCWKIVPFGEWSKKSMEEEGLTQAMDPVPHGIDLDIFQPRDKKACRANWIDKKHNDDFIIGTVAGNYDKERKQWDKHFKAIKYFKEQNPDAKFKYYVHTDVFNVKTGLDLTAMVKFYGLEKCVYHPDPYIFINQLPYNRMGEIYNMFDVHMLTSAREGFGMPILEAQACGVPSLATDFAQGKEHTHKDLRVKVKAKTMTPIIGESAVPDAWDTYEKLQKLYDSDKFREKHSKIALKNARKYDWNGPNVKGKWITRLDEIEEALKIDNAKRKKKNGKK